ncbi:hypothetical protein B0I35DRAFT_21671 [Stachybotrys elegans]|uniref:Uncharacterized protein n=1 Tax=Stachybotrys elegans TaxID=80388 RepID=A0A8K0T1M9_9HYPO|nr:hypothetical protein B0I35DRAFT_21671 [Stachybotrys elegans]
MPHSTRGHACSLLLSLSLLSLAILFLPVSAGLFLEKCARAYPPAPRSCPTYAQNGHIGTVAGSAYKSVSQRVGRNRVCTLLRHARAAPRPPCMRYQSTGPSLLHTAATHLRYRYLQQQPLLPSPPRLLPPRSISTFFFFLFIFGDRAERGAAGKGLSILSFANACPSSQEARSQGASSEHVLPSGLGK